MKNRLLTLFAIAICAIFPALSSCEKEFNPRDKYKDITIVYGLVNPVDTVHYLRIHKAFLGPENILLMAKEPDSSLYPIEALDVRVYDVDEKGNSTRLPVRIEEIDNKDTTGYFYATTHRVYCFEKIFEKTLFGDYKRDDIIKIEVENKKTGKIVYAQTSIVNNFNVTAPRENLALDLDPKKTSSKFTWHNAKYGRIYDVYYTMRYREGRHDKPSSDYERKTIVWHVGSYSARNTGNGGSEQTQNFSFNPGAFYAQIVRDIPYDEGLWRTPYDSVSVSIWCGSEDLYYYHNINRPGGVVQERPEYTNLKTKIYSEELGKYQEVEGEAFGIFTSRNVQYIPIHLSSDMTGKHLPGIDRQFKGVAFQD